MESHWAKDCGLTKSLVTLGLFFTVRKQFGNIQTFGKHTNLIFLYPKIVLNGYLGSSNPREVSYTQPDPKLGN